MTYDKGRHNIEEQAGASIKGVGKLNPRWVEHLMGLPPGWVSPDPVGPTQCTSRVDELRLLGNGVVPQTAIVAFKTLADRLGL